MAGFRWNVEEKEWWGNQDAVDEFYLLTDPLKGKRKDIDAVMEMNYDGIWKHCVEFEEV